MLKASKTWFLGLFRWLVQSEQVEIRSLSTPPPAFLNHSLQMLANIMFLQVNLCPRSTWPRSRPAGFPVVVTRGLPISPAGPAMRRAHQAWWGPANGTMMASPATGHQTLSSNRVGRPAPSSLFAVRPVLL